MQCKITEALDKYCPLKNRLIKDSWLSPEILEFIHDKDRARKKAIQTGEPADLRVAKELRNEAKAMVRRAKASYIQEESDRHTRDPKEFWEKMSLILPKNKKMY